MTGSNSHSEMSDRQGAKEATQKGEERFRLTFENAPVGIAIVGLDFQVEQVNPSLCRLLGLTQSELLAHAFLDLTHPDDLEKHRKLAQQLVRGDLESYQLEKRCLTKEGSIVWVKLSVTLVRNSQGAATYALAMLEDLTEHRRIVDALTTGTQATEPIAKTEKVARGTRMDEVEREHILRILEQTYWRIEGPQGAAEILGMNPGTLRSRMKKLGIRRPRTR
jgi:PAS domain S-box-containing protein